MSHFYPLLALGNATGDCVHSKYPWTEKYLGECTENDKQFIGMLLGLTSILCWLVAQLPQLIKNYQNGKAESLSIWFLADWLTGDISNLIGCVLTKQVPTQLYTAIYFCLIDSAMVIQWLYYKNKKPEHKALAYGIMTIFAAGFCWLPSVASGSGTTPHHNGRVLLSYEPHGTTEITGYVFGWISGILYFTSRIPQIVKNFRRRTCEGLSITMFIMAVLGNLTYALGVLLMSVEVDFIEAHLPWLIGSIGTLVFDFTIFCQFLCFGQEMEEIDPDDERQPLNSEKRKRFYDD